MTDLTNYSSLERLVKPKLTKYILHKPTPKQSAFLLLDCYEAFYGGAAGGGKEITLGTVIATPSSWTTIGDLHVGDELFDEHGAVCSVEHLFDIDPEPESYELVFDDGSRQKACADHKWLTFSAKELSALTRYESGWRARRRARRASDARARRAKNLALNPLENRGRHARPDLILRNAARKSECLGLPTGSIRTTREIAELLRTASGRSNHAIPVAGALQLPVVKLTVDPYVLGAWLGDGSAAGGTLAGIDAFIWEEIGRAGYIITAHKNKYSHGILGLVGQLRTLGVKDNKHVPAQYLRASRDQRLALLQGLMDTDGTVYASGSVEFTNTNKRIADGVYELIVSLGWKAQIIEGRAVLDGRDCGPKYDIKWTPDDYVFRLPRKRSKQKLAQRRTTKFRYVASCERIASEPMRCIKVSSPSGLFLAGRSMIPTHKSDALLSAALQFVDVPGYTALIVRRTFKQLAEPEAIMDRAKEWLMRTDAKWNADLKTFYFPSGARLVFGYMEHEDDKLQYQGAAFQFVGFDEVTQLTESQYLYLVGSRVRRPALTDATTPAERERLKYLAQVPLRARSASNPGGPGHDWVRKRMIKEGKARGIVFIPSNYLDNEHLDTADYEKRLEMLDPVTRAQLKAGNWDARPEGGYFKREHAVIVTAVPTDIIALSRGWDLAASEDEANCRTAGVKIGRRANGKYIVLNATYDWWSPAQTEKVVRATALMDGHKTRVKIEQEPGAGGVTLIDHYVRDVLAGWAISAARPSTSKCARAAPFSAQWDNGNVDLLKAPWNEDYINELLPFFTEGALCDLVDASAHAFNDLTDPSVEALEWARKELERVNNGGEASDDLIKVYREARDEYNTERGGQRAETIAKGRPGHVDTESPDYLKGLLSSTDPIGPKRP